MKSTAVIIILDGKIPASCAVCRLRKQNKKSGVDFCPITLMAIDSIYLEISDDPSLMHREPSCPIYSIPEKMAIDIRSERVTIDTKNLLESFAEIENHERYLHYYDFKDKQIRSVP